MVFGLSMWAAANFCRVVSNSLLTSESVITGLLLNILTNIFSFDGDSLGLFPDLFDTSE